MSFRCLSGLIILVSLACAVVVVAVAGPKHSILDPGPGGGGGVLPCEQWWEVDPEGELSGPVEVIEMRNGEGKLFLKKPCGWTP